MFRRTRKVLKGVKKAIKLGAVVVPVAKAGLWVYEKTKPQKAKPTPKTKANPKKKAKIK